MPMTLTYRLRPLLAIVVLALLALPATAIAKPRDRNHNRIPDKWEKRHGLFTKKRAAARKVARKDNDKDGLRNRAEHRSGTHPKRRDTDGDRKPDAGEDRDKDKVDNGNEIREGTNPRRRDTDRDGKGDGREDRDRDGLNNAGEDATGNDPLDRDSDDDGVRDGRERAGTVASFADGVLTIDLAVGGTLTGFVADFTKIKCSSEAAAERGHRKAAARVATDDEEPFDDDGGDVELGEDELGDDEPTDDGGFDAPAGGGDNGGKGGDHRCTEAALRRGARVRKARLALGEDGLVFEKIYLVR